MLQTQKPKAKIYIYIELVIFSMSNIVQINNDSYIRKKNNQYYTD